MQRAAALLAAALVALPAAAQLFETDPKKIQEGWRKEKLEELKSRDAKTRAGAARWLDGRNDPETITALTAVLNDPDAQVRMEAASALWSAEKSAEPARAALTALLDDPDPNVVTHAAGAMQSLGMKEEQLAPVRKRALDHPQATTHSKYLLARNLVGFEDPQKLLPHLLGYLERAATDTGVNAHRNLEAAHRTLTRLVTRTQDAGLVAPLREATRTLKGGNAFVLKLLNTFEKKPPDHLEFVLGFLDARDAKMRSAAFDVLRETKGEAAIAVWMPRVVPLLAHPDEEMRSQAAATMGSAAGLAAPHADLLVKALADPSPRVRRSAANSLGYVGEGRQAISAADRARVAAARPALQGLAERDPDNEVKQAATEALRRISTGGTELAAAALAPGGNEAQGLAVLRARKISFEPGMYQRALYEGDVEAVQAFLDAGMSPKARLPNTGSPLWVVLFDAKACHPTQRPSRDKTKATLKLLLDRGADPNVADEHGNVPLMAAAMRGCDREVMKTLLKAGAKVDARNTAGLSSFEFGLMTAHDGLEELIAAGYRLPPDKLKQYQQAYADKPVAQAMIKKAAAKK